MTTFGSLPSRRVRAGVSLLACAASLLWAPALINAQTNPDAFYYAYDSRPFNGYPPTYPGEVIGPDAVVVEGLGAGLCGTSTLYTEAKIEQQTVSWLNANYNTFTEITPQANCGTVSDWEGVVDRIVAYVEAHAPAYAPTNWAGIMLDEEPGYLLTATQLESLNNHVHTTMAGTPGMSWFFLEDQPNGWALATYHAILAAGSGTPAAQAYSSSMVNAINNACTTYSDCINLVTVWNGATPSWNDPEYTLPRVHGAAWFTTYGTWHPGDGWWNGYRNQ